MSMRIKGAALAIGLGLALGAPAWAQTAGPQPLVAAGTADLSTDPEAVPAWCPDPYEVANRYWSCLHDFDYGPDDGQQPSSCAVVAQELPLARRCAIYLHRHDKE